MLNRRLIHVINSKAVLSKVQEVSPLTAAHICVVVIIHLPQCVNESISLFYVLPCLQSSKTKNKSKDTKRSLSIINISKKSQIFQIFLVPPSDSPGMTRTDQADAPLTKKNPWKLERN